MSKRADARPSKLVLARETLVPLDPDQLSNINGGMIGVTKGQSCCVFNSCNKGIAE